MRQSQDVMQEDYVSIQAWLWLAVLRSEVVSATTEVTCLVVAITVTPVLYANRLAVEHHA